MDAIEEKYWDLMTKSLSGNLSAEEQEELDEWLSSNPENANHFKELQDVWSKAEDYGQSFRPNTAKAWKNVAQKLEFELNETHAPVRQLSIFYKVAAAIILVIGSYWIIQQLNHKEDWIEIASNEAINEVLFPDGSKAWLSSHSNIRYQKTMNDAKSRIIELTGEAFFEVSHNPDKPFIIKALETETRVLGTSFNVDARKNAPHIKVSVVTGKVQFSSLKANDNKVILEPSTQGVYTYADQTLRKEVLSNKNFLFWKNKELQFENIRISDIIEELNQSYNVQIRIADASLADERITTSFENQTIDEILNELKILLDIDVKKDGNRYTIAYSK